MRTPPVGVAALAALVVLAGCGEDATGTAEPSETSSSASSSGPEATDDLSESETEEAVPDGDAAVAVVQRWLEAARSGDTDALADLTGSFSLRNVEDIGGLEENASGLAEGMGAFADADAATWSAVVIPARDDAWLVVLDGTVTREGMTEQAARSWIVHPEGDRGQVVESFSSPLPGIESPPPSSPQLAADAPVDVYLAAGGGTGTVLLDGGPIADGVQVASADGDLLRVTALPPDGWPAGEHVVTVAAVPAEGDGETPWVSVAVPIVVG